MTPEPLEETTNKIERRHTQRKKFRGGIEIEWGSAILNGSVRDIGPRGLFVEMSPPLWIGAAFRARLIVHPVLLLDCTVARVEPGIGLCRYVFEVAEESAQSCSSKRF